MTLTNLSDTHIYNVLRQACAGCSYIIRGQKLPQEKYGWEWQ